jgi:hypothetical protein
MLAKLNAHPRDKRIQFCDPPKQAADGSFYRDHFYVIDGKVYRNSSGTALKKEYFKDNFDAERASKGDVELQKKWKIGNAETIEFGVFHHKHYENYMNELPFQFDPKYPQYTCYEDLPGWPYFKAFLQTLEPWWIKWRVEWPIFSLDASLPGTIDLVLRDSRFPDELVLMVVDYKMRKKPTAMPYCSCGSWAPVAEGHNEGCTAIGSKPASSVILRRKCDEDGVQVCIYTKILEDLYGARVTKMVVAYLHPGTAEEIYPMYLHVVDREIYHDLICDMFESRMTTE